MQAGSYASSLDSGVSGSGDLVGWMGVQSCVEYELENLMTEKRMIYY